MSDDNEAAEPDLWKTRPMPEQTAFIPFHRRYSTSEMQSIRQGLIPEEMEDKWFMFMAGDTLFIHRSWTGHCIYHIRFIAEGEDHVPADVMVNRDPEQYKNTDEQYDARLLAFLIDNLLLSGSTPFPMPSDNPKIGTAGLYQHHVVGTGYTEAAVEAQDKPA